MSIRRIVSIFLTIIMIVSVVPTYADNSMDAARMQVKRGSSAYLEPVEDELYYAGKFKYASAIEVVNILNPDTDDVWYEIAYLYEEDNQSDAEKRSVYVKGTDVLPLQPSRSGESMRNVLVDDLDPDSVVLAVTIPEFEELLLVDHKYTPSENRNETVGIVYSSRVSTVGETADFSDILVQKTGNDTSRTSNIYTPLIRFNESGDTNIQYPIDNKAESLLTAEESAPEYTITSEYDIDQKVLSGVKFILENSPPFKTYTHYPADFENASRVSASLAIRQFMHDYAGTKDDIDIFNGIAAQDINSFNNNYRSYMEYLYYGAVEEYEKAKNEEPVYISADISKEPYLSGDQFITELRVTTNNPQGWIIDKSSLPEGVTISGATETDAAFIGESGSVPLSVSSSLKLMGQKIQINICYNNTEPVVQFAFPQNASYPTLVTLAHQSSVIPVKKLIIDMPESASLKIKANDADTGAPLAGVKIHVSNSVIVKTIKTDQNGVAALQSVPGKYSYESVTKEGYSSVFTGDVVIESGKEETVSMAFEKQKYSISVNAINAFDETVTIDNLQFVLKRLDDNAFEDISKETSGGNATFDGLPEGNYQIQIVPTKAYVSLDKEYKISVHDNPTEEITVNCVPASGKLKLGCKHDDEYIAGVSFEILKDGVLVKTAETVKDGPTYVNLPAGEYVLHITGTPDGYKDAAQEKKFKIKQDNTEGIRVKIEPDYAILTVCPRLPSDYENFKSLKSKIRDKSISLNGMKFALIAEEEILNKNGDVAFEPGTEVLRMDKTQGKTISATGRIMYPGKYILRCIKTVDGTNIPEDITINIEKGKDELIVPVRVEAQETAEVLSEEEPSEIIEDAEFPDEEIVEEVALEEEEIETESSDVPMILMTLSVRKPVTASASVYKDKNGISCLKASPVYMAADHIPVIIARFPSGNETITQTSELGIVSYSDEDTGAKHVAFVPSVNSIYDPASAILNPGENEISLSIKNTAITMTRVYMQSDAPEKAVYGLFVESWEYGKLTEQALRTPIEAHSGLLGKVFFNLPLPAGRYFISPILDYDNGGYDPDSKTYFEITTPGDSIELTEARELMYQVTLTVKDNDNGAAMQGVYIDIAGKEKSVQHYTNADGKITMWMSPGEYDASVVLVPEYYAVKEGYDHFVLHDNGEITGKTEFNIIRNQLVIKTQDTEGAPLYGVTVEITNQQTKSSVLTTTDKSGYAVFESLPFGKYIISERYPSAGYETNRKRISVVVDGTFVNNDAPLATFVDQKNRMSCSVGDDQNTAVQNCLVAVSDYTGSTVQTAYTGADGRAVLENIPIGVYYMDVIETPAEYLIPFDTNKIIVTIDGVESERQLSFNVKKSSFQLVLRDSDGNGINGAEFSLISKDNAEIVQRKLTSYDGTLAFTDFTKGEYIIRETAPLNHTAPVDDIDITIDNNWVSGTPIELTTFPNYYEFTVKDNKGQPVALAAFTIENTETHETKGDFSGKSGNVKFEGLTKGTYIIRQTKTEPQYEMSDETITIKIDENYKISDKKYSYIVRKIK